LSKNAGSGSVLSQSGSTTLVKCHGIQRRIRIFSVTNPIELLGPEDDLIGSAVAVSQYYKDDPVHLSEAGYADLCTQLVEKMGTEDETHWYRSKSGAAD
jgi:hypothetical protein